MKDTRLIVISGMSGSGKSTMAQRLAGQLELNDVDHVWLHEEAADHPVRAGEFCAAARDTEEGMDTNVRDVYRRWARLVREIAASEKVYVMEGCLYQNIVRYFLGVHYPLEKITAFYDRVAEITAQLNPTIVFLYRTGVQSSFEEAFRVRGERWRNLVLDPEGEGYFQRHEYAGDESIYAMWEHYQRIAGDMFTRYRGHKIKLCTSEGSWDSHLRRLTEYLGLQFRDQQVPPVENPELYCGTYALDLDGQESVLGIKLADGALYCEVGWWSNMKLIPLGEHRFGVQSFPITLTFDIEGDRRGVCVGGSYGWRLTGRTLWEA